MTVKNFMRQTHRTISCIMVFGITQNACYIKYLDKNYTHCGVVAVAKFGGIFWRSFSAFSDANTYPGPRGTQSMLAHLLFFIGVVASVECASFPALAVLSSRLAAYAVNNLHTHSPDTAESLSALSSKIKEKLSQLSAKFCNYDSTTRDVATIVSTCIETVSNTCNSISSVDLDTDTDADSCEDEIDSDACDNKFWSAFDQDNEHALGLLTQLDNTEGWTYVTEKLGVLVEKKIIDAGEFVDKADAEKGSKHACVKSSAVLDASPESVFNLFADNLRVKEYNEHCAGITDIKVQPKVNYGDPTSSAPSTQADADAAALSTTNGLSSALKQTWSKISHAVTPHYNPFKSRDFLSVVHYQKYANGTSVILNRPAYLSSHRPSDSHVRATVLLAGNIIRPHGAFRNQTHLTLIAQVNPGGGADTPAAAWLLNKLCAVGPPAFIRRLEAAAKQYTITPADPAAHASAPAPSVLVSAVVNGHINPGNHQHHGDSAAVNSEFGRPNISPFTLDLLREAKVTLQDTTSELFKKCSYTWAQLQQSEDYQELKRDIHEGIHNLLSTATKQSQLLAKGLQARRPALERTVGKYMNVFNKGMSRSGMFKGRWAQIVSERMKAEMNCRYHCSGEEEHTVFEPGEQFARSENTDPYEGEVESGVVSDSAAGTSADISDAPIDSCDEASS